MALNVTGLSEKDILLIERVKEHIGVVTTVLVSQSHTVSSHVSAAEQPFRKSGT